MVFNTDKNLVEFRKVKEYQCKDIKIKVFGYIEILYPLPFWKVHTYT